MGVIDTSVKITVGNDDTNRIITTTSTNSSGNYPQINIGDTWENTIGLQINIGDTWKSIEGMQINIGDTWKPMFASVPIVLGMTDTNVAGSEYEMNMEGDTGASSTEFTKNMNQDDVYFEFSQFWETTSTWPKSETLSGTWSFKYYGKFVINAPPLFVSGHCRFRVAKYNAVDGETTLFYSGQSGLSTTYANRSVNGTAAGEIDTDDYLRVYIQCRTWLDIG